MARYDGANDRRSKPNWIVEYVKIVQARVSHDSDISSELAHISPTFIQLPTNLVDFRQKIIKWLGSGRWSFFIKCLHLTVGHIKKRSCLSDRNEPAKKWTDLRIWQTLAPLA